MFWEFNLMDLFLKDKKSKLAPQQPKAHLRYCDDYEDPVSECHGQDTQSDGEGVKPCFGCEERDSNIHQLKYENDELVRKLKEAESASKKLEQANITKLKNLRANFEQECNQILHQKQQLYIQKINKLWKEHDQFAQARHGEIQRLQNELAEHEVSLRETQEKHFEERVRQQGELDNLQTLYIKSVNTIGTGLEPICDSEFEEKFAAMHTKVNGWCRKAFVSKGKAKKLTEIDRDLSSDLSDRLSETDSLNHGQLMDLLTWLFLEKNIFQRWFPLDYKQIDCLSVLEGHLRYNDREIAYEKTEYWRAYTASLLFQHPETSRSFADMADDASSALQNILLKVQSEGELSLHKNSLEHLVEIVKSAIVLAAELKCQRACYEVEDDVVPGDQYDKSRMNDIRGDADEEDESSSWIVTCVLSNGWIKTPFKGSSDGVVRICKARVLVAECSEQNGSEWQ